MKKMGVDRVLKFTKENKTEIQKVKNTMHARKKKPQ